MDEERPLGGFTLSLLAGILIFADGAIVAAAGGQVASAGYGSIGGAIAGLGELAAFFGFLVFLFSFGLLLNPERHVAWGIAILVLSLASILGGGGFILGLILGVVGGVLALRFEYDPESLPDEDPFAPAALASSGLPRARFCPGCGRASTSRDVFCQGCGKPLPVA